MPSSRKAKKRSEKKSDLGKQQSGQCSLADFSDTNGNKGERSDISQNCDKPKANTEDTREKISKTGETCAIVDTSVKQIDINHSTSVSTENKTDSEYPKTGNVINTKSNNESNGPPSPNSPVDTRTDSSDFNDTSGNIITIHNDSESHNSTNSNKPKSNATGYQLNLVGKPTKEYRIKPNIAQQITGINPSNQDDIAISSLSFLAHIDCNLHFYTIRYLFCWDSVPGADDDRLLFFLEDVLGVKWVNNTKITRENDGTITVGTEKKAIHITLDKEKEKVIIKDRHGKKIHTLIVNEKNGKLNTYDQSSVLKIETKSGIKIELYSTDSCKNIIINGDILNREILGFSGKEAFINSGFRIAYKPYTSEIFQYFPTTIGRKDKYFFSLQAPLYNNEKKRLQLAMAMVDSDMVENTNNVLSYAKIHMPYGEFLMLGSQILNKSTRCRNKLHEFILKRDYNINNLDFLKGAIEGDFERNCLNYGIKKILEARNIIFVSEKTGAPIIYVRVTGFEAENYYEEIHPLNIIEDVCGSFLVFLYEFLLAAYSFDIDISCLHYEAETADKPGKYFHGKLPMDLADKSRSCIVLQLIDLLTPDGGMFKDSLLPYISIDESGKKTVSRDGIKLIYDSIFQILNSPHLKHRNRTVFETFDENINKFIKKMEELSAKDRKLQ